MEKKTSLTKKEVEDIIGKMMRCEYCMEILHNTMEHALRGTELGIHFSKEHSGEFHVHYGGS